MRRLPRFLTSFHTTYLLSCPLFFSTSGSHAPRGAASNARTHALRARMNGAPPSRRGPSEPGRAFGAAPVSGIALHGSSTRLQSICTKMHAAGIPYAVPFPHRRLSASKGTGLRPTKRKFLVSFGFRQPVSFGFASAQFRNCQSTASSFPLVEEHAAPLRALQAKPGPSARLAALNPSLPVQVCGAHGVPITSAAKARLPTTNLPVVSPCFGAWNSAHVHPRLPLRPPHLV